MDGLLRRPRPCSENPGIETLKKARGPKCFAKCRRRWNVSRKDFSNLEAPIDQFE